MKKIVLFISLVAMSLTVKAQNNNNLVPFKGYILAQTTLDLTLTVCEERIVTGPYAKYAQQLLGVSAPLNDKKSYTITSSSINSVVDGDFSNIYKLEENTEGGNISDLSSSKANYNSKAVESGWSDQKHVEFSDMGIDPIVTSLASDEALVAMQHEKSFDEMAADAAATIFRLRRRRFDLITGDFGEGVFGEGLKAAIDEMARIESEYLSLFIGKRYVSYRQYNYVVTPEKGKNSYILARFSDTKGILDLTTIDGNPLVLTVTPEGKYAAQPEKKEVVTTESTGKKGKEPVVVEKVVARYQVADNAMCKLFNATTLLNSKRMAILQLGHVVEKTKLEQNKK